MRKKWLIWLAALLVLASLVLWLARTREPSYGGRSASAWLDSVDNPGLPERPEVSWNEVTTAFQAMGSDAARFLVREIERKPSWLDRQLSDLKHGSALPDWLKERVPERHDHRRTAAEVLPHLGRDAEPALPLLLRIFREGDPEESVRSHAYATLAALGDRIDFLVPELIQGLIDGQSHSPTLCADLLGSIGPTAWSAVPALETALEEGGWLTREAAWALLKIDGRTNLAVGVFTQNLSHTNSSIRQFAFYDLRQLGAAAAPALPKIQQALWDSDEQIRNEAVKSLRELDPARLKQSVQQMNDDLPAQVQRLIDTIERGPLPQCYRAVNAVAVIGPTAEPAVPALVGILRATSSDQFRLPTNAMRSTALSHLKLEAARALGAIGPDARLAVPALVERVRAQREEWTGFYCQALGRMGPAAIDARPALHEALTHEALGVRLAAAIALTRIDPGQCSNAVQVLKTFENDAWPQTRLEAATALWRLDRTLPSPVSALIETARQAETWAIELLGDLGADTNGALPALTGTLQRDPSGLLCRDSAIAIRKIDPEAAARLGLPGLLALP